MCELYELVEFLEKVNKQGYLKFIVNGEIQPTTYSLNDNYRAENNLMLEKYSRAEVQKITMCDDGYIYITLYI